MNNTTQAHSRATSADTEKYQQFSALVEKIAETSQNPIRTRSRLWVARLTREYLGGV